MILGDPQDRLRWRGALVAAGLNAIAMPMDLVLARGIPQMPLWPSLGSSAVGIALCAVLVAGRRRPSVRFVSAVFLINNLAILVALWVTSGYWATTTRWLPFQANKLAVLAVALLAPSARVGLAVIAGFVGMVMLKVPMLSPEIRSRFPVGEPWTILIYGLFAGSLLVYRMHGLALEQSVLHAKSERAAAERLARTFLAVRDFTNTPLQTIELAAEVIRRRDPDLAPILARIDRSVDRLFRLNRTFAAFDAHLKWTSDDVSVDSRPIIDREPEHAPAPR